ncbi:hypothetical protein FG379_000507 [Cryptosporidium bovis]|uniref:uncharacterized protein n=1 Tax=Cryptosporidium bovis TaxID=310047 RepID=UPI00351A720C|nr:hypothetical protein FG379_000507 [Cryptosporidium bovis]
MNNILLLLVYVYFTLCISLNVCIGTDEQKLENRFSPPWRTSKEIRNLQLLSKRSDLIYSFIEKFRGEYASVCNPKSAIHNDIVVDIGSIPGKLESSNFFHIPSERRSLKKFKKLSMEFGNLVKNPDVLFREIRRPADPEHNLFFPRIKHFRNKLPVLTPEPYQRLMTFAIEVCMIPKLWYLELIHCMYVGMAPFFKGMLMSYSLQDVVGSAIMTIGYLDSKFSIENCHRSVSMVSDDSISPNYEYICDKMKTCLESRVFENGEYARFREEFKKRIEESYKLTNDDNIDKHELASYYLKLGISTSPYSNGFEKDHNARNFLPVRTMVSLISTINMTRKFSTLITSIVQQFNAFYYLISYGTMISIEKYFVFCKRFLETNIKINFVDKKLLFEFLCKDFVSVGFIDESFNIMGDDEDKFIQAIQPSRILRKNYAEVIPSMPSDESLESFGKEWLEFTADELEITEAPLSRPATGKFYKSKLLSKTKKKGMRDPRTVKSSEHTAKGAHLGATKRIVNKLRRLTLPKLYSNAFLIDQE